MNSTKYQRVQAEAKRVFKNYKALLQIDVEGIRAGILEGDDINNIRHRCSNYEVLYPLISKEELTEVAEQAIAKLKNHVNSLIWGEQQSFINTLLTNVEALNTENKQLCTENEKLEGKLSSLKVSFRSMLKYNAEITSELRAELVATIENRRQYVIFISNLCDCSYNDALGAV